MLTYIYKENSGMDNENMYSSTNTIRFCGSCGKEIKSICQFCPYCGKKIKVPTQTSQQPKNKGLIITLVSVLLVLLLIIGVIFFGGVPLTSNEKDNNPISIKKKLTAQEYLEKTLLSEYQLAENDITLTYKYIDGDALIDCTNFKESILGYRIADFNNDGDDDIYVVKLKKSDDNKRDDNYSQLVFESSVYLANDSGDFNHCLPTIFGLYYNYYNNPTLNDYYTKNFYFAIHQTSNSDYYLLTSTIIEDDQDLYEEGGTYYSIENSLGDLETTLYIDKISDVGVSDALFARRYVSHIDGMPEAESYYYYLGESGSTYDELISGGIKTVYTGDYFPVPELKGEISGPCSSENEACEKINAELDKYELQDYHLDPFKWENRYDNSFFLNKGNINAINFETRSVSTDEKSGEFIIDLR